MAAPVMSLDVLPASFGDCLLLTCHTLSRPWRLLADTGPDEIYAAQQRHLRSLTPNPQGKQVVDTLLQPEEVRQVARLNRFALNPPQNSGRTALRHQG